MTDFVDNVEIKRSVVDIAMRMTKPGGRMEGSSRVCLDESGAVVDLVELVRVDTR